MAPAKSPPAPAPKPAPKPAPHSSPNPSPNPAPNPNPARTPAYNPAPNSAPNPAPAPRPSSRPSRHFWPFFYHPTRTYKPTCGEAPWRPVADYMAAVSVDNGTAHEAWCHVAQCDSTCACDPQTHARALVGEGVPSPCSNTTIPATSCSGAIHASDGFVQFDNVTYACVDPTSVYSSDLLPTFVIPEAATSAPASASSWNFFNMLVWCVLGVVFGTVLIGAVCGKRKKTAAAAATQLPPLDPPPAPPRPAHRPPTWRPESEVWQPDPSQWPESQRASATAPPIAQVAQAPSQYDLPMAEIALPSRPPPRPPRSEFQTVSLT